MYEELSNRQINRIANTNFDDKKAFKRLLRCDIKLIMDLAFKMSGKSELPTKKMEFWIRCALIELGCEKLRREGILMRTSKGWKETKLGKEKRKSLEKSKQEKK